MIVAIREFYLARSTREQRLILLMAAIAAPLLAWLLIIRPLGSGYEAALDRHLESVDRNGRVKALAENARSGEAPGTRAPGPDIALLVAESASRSGLAIESGGNAGAGAVSVSVASAPPVTAMQWLRELELGGVRVEELRMVPAGQGMVSLTARLARAGQ